MNPKCNHCNSSKTIRDGVRKKYPSQRYKCKSCKRSFTKPLLEEKPKFRYIVYTPFVCPNKDCDESRVTKNGFYWGKKKPHERQRYKCTTCGKNFQVYYHRHLSKFILRSSLSNKTIAYMHKLMKKSRLSNSEIRDVVSKKFRKKMYLETIKRHRAYLEAGKKDGTN